MKSTDASLRQHYSNMESDELIELYKNADLTHVAETALKAVLSERGIAIPEERTAIHNDLADNAAIRKAISVKIRNGWIAAVVLGAITFGLGMVILLSTKGADGTVESLVYVVSALTIFGLAVGVAIRSRVAATGLFVLFLAKNLLDIWAVGMDGLLSGLLFKFAFFYFFYQAMIATFSYCNLTKKGNVS